MFSQKSGSSFYSVATLSFCSNPKVTYELLPGRDNTSLNVGIGFLNLSEELNISLPYIVSSWLVLHPQPHLGIPLALPWSRYSPNPDSCTGPGMGTASKAPVSRGHSSLIQGLFLHLDWQTFPSGAKSFAPLTKSMFYSGICREEGLVVEGLQSLREVKLFGN